VKALIFDLDGTLLDSVYAHTMAWQKALAEFGIPCPAWAIHRRIGMSGDVLAQSIARAQSRTLSEDDIDALGKDHARRFREMAPNLSPLPGAVALLAYLAELHISHGIATSGQRAEVENSLNGLSLSPSAVVVDGGMVREVKPEPDLFLACQQKLKVERSDCLVVGDAVWDIHAARRSGILSVGVLTGGFGEQELYNAGAMRVYQDCSALHAGLEELGFSQQGGN